MTEPTVKLITQQQSLSPDAFVSLYTFDASPISGGVFRFANSTEADGSNIYFGGLEYPALDFAAEGFEWNGESMPRPKITASVQGSNTLSNSFLNLVVSCCGAQGAVLYRSRTLARYLDGHEDAGCDVKFPVDIYIVDRIISLTTQSVQWELIAATDLPNMKLPCRTAFRDTCQWIYRRWNTDTSAFTYDTSTMACPYAGTSYFTKAGVVTTQDKDICGHRFADCVLRYGDGEALPFGGFPGLGQGS